VQLKRIRPDLEIVPIRGNLNTRIEKLFTSNLDAIIVARAGVERLGLQQSISQIISTDVIIPAVGQGVIAIEIHKDNTFAKEVIECLNDIETEYAIRAERAFLQEMGGGCRNPIAAFATIINYEIFIDGMVASTDGNLYYRSSVFDNAIEPEQAGKKLANEILSLGAKNIILNPATTSN
jgi:hydroxymethylbilane synthase